MKLTVVFASLLLALMPLTSLAQGRPAPNPSPAPMPILLELFTSEGCSSCPPADAMLRRLNGKTSASGQLLIGLSEHVTYWNQLGWSDPFSSYQFTDRQNAYGERFNLDSVYTPQLVVNGRVQMNGANGDDIQCAIAAQSHTLPEVPVHILSSTVSAGKISIAFSVLSGVPARGVDLFAVVADDFDQSEVQRGENRGRTLAHVAVARDMVHIAHVKQPTENQLATITLPQGRRDASEQHLVLFAQLPHYGPVVGADSLRIAQH